MTSIILVEPQMGENIGAAARAMFNFGFTDLRIVAPRDGWKGTVTYDKAHEMSAKADFIIEKATVFDSLENAIADLNTIYAATARPREMTKPVITPAQIEIAGKTGILFGRENNGLTNAEVNLANKIITIPVSDKYSSINIAMSVGIICYEIFQITNHQTPITNLELATRDDIAGFIKHTEDELDKAGFFTIPQKKPGMMANFANIFTRNNLTVQEVKTLRGVIRSISGKSDSA